MSSIKLSDRVKELSYTVGTGVFHLNGAVHGFSSFSSQYNYNEYLFYAITDGTNYEVGSGQYFLDGSDNALRRFPFRSSNNDNVVNFGIGLKEVYVTYPATHSVYTGSGVFDINFPQKSGIAFWDTANVINYTNNLVWDNNNKRIGVIKSNPQYGIDIGGDGRESSIQASGFYVGSSGVLFPSGNNGDVAYTGGRQVVHFMPNQLGDSNIQAVLELSGIVNNTILFKEQNAGLVFAGPPSGCSPPCLPALPSFRPLILNDIEDAVDLSGILTTDIASVSGLLYSASGVLRSDLTTVSGIAQYGYDSSGVLRTDLTTVSGIAQYGYDSSGVLRTDLTTVSGLFDYGYYASGTILTHTHGNLSNSGTLGSTSGLMVITESGGYITTSQLPAPYFATITNYNDPGTSGQIVFDSDYVYFNVPSGDSPTGLVWKRATIAIWG